MTIGSLFSGIGGLEFGLEMCGLGPVLWQCDSDPAARAVLAEHWPEARRYEDVGHIDATAAFVSLVCGGFPCQPHSVAGDRRGTADARWLWPDFARIIGELRPDLVFVENVPGLRTSGLQDVLADLARLGFDAEWGLYTAAEVGAPHIRRRLFVLAHAHGRRKLQSGGPVGEVGRRSSDGGRTLAHADGIGLFGRAHRQEAAQPAGICAAEGDHPWSAEPDVGRMAHGIPRRVDRLRLLGNSVVPAQAAHAFRDLAGRLAS